MVELDEKQKEFAYLPLKIKNSIIMGPCGSGKTCALQERYRRLTNSGTRDDKILVLVMNSHEVSKWKEALDSNVRGNENIFSYFGFVENEVKLYWPLVEDKITGIKQGMIDPVFLDIETSDYLLGQIIRYYTRQKRKNADISGILNIVSSPDSLTADIGNNLSKAAVYNMDYMGLCSRMALYTNGRDGDTDILFDDIYKIMNMFRERCLANGALTYSIALEIYMGYLLKDSRYMECLKKRYDHLIMDNMEEAYPAQIDFADMLLNYCETSCFSFSTDGGYTRILGADPDYGKAKLFSRCEIYKLDKIYTCTSNNAGFSSVLENNIMTGSFEKYDGCVYIHGKSFEFKNDMIRGIAESIEEEAEKGTPLSHIAVISPVNDEVFNMILTGYLRKKDIYTANIIRRKRLIDEHIINAVVTAGILCRQGFNIKPSPFDIRVLFSEILGLDMIRSSLLQKHVYSSENYLEPLKDVKIRERVGFGASKDYDVLREWIDAHCGDDDVPFDSLLEMFFIDIAVRFIDDSQKLNLVKHLIKSAGSFIQCVSEFDKKDKSCDMEFISMLKQGARSTKICQKLQEDNMVVLSTPFSYLVSGLNSDIQIWADTTNERWMSSGARLLCNPYILQTNKVWDGTADMNAKLKQLSTVTKCLIRRCSGKILLFESELSDGLYEQEGILHEYVLKTKKMDVVL